MHLQSVTPLSFAGAPPSCPNPSSNLVSLFPPKSRRCHHFQRPKTQLTRSSIELLLVLVTHSLCSPVEHTSFTSERYLFPHHRNGCHVAYAYASCPTSAATIEIRPHKTRPALALHTHNRSFLAVCKRLVRRRATFVRGNTVTLDTCSALAVCELRRLLEPPILAVLVSQTTPFSFVERLFGDRGSQLHNIRCLSCPNLP